MLRGKTQEADLVSISTDICTYKVSEQNYYSRGEKMKLTLIVRCKKCRRTSSNNVPMERGLQLYHSSRLGYLGGIFPYLQVNNFNK